MSRDVWSGASKLRRGNRASSFQNTAVFWLSMLICWTFFVGLAVHLTHPASLTAFVLGTFITPIGAVRGLLILFGVL